MRLRSILSEAGRNLRTGTTRALSFGVLLAAINAGLAIADTRSIVDIEQRAAGFVAAGASVRKMVAKQSTDPAACERLGEVQGIRSAGALRETDAIVLSTMRSSAIPAYAVSPGFLHILGGTADAPAGVWISTELAGTLAVQPGHSMATTVGSLTVAGVFDYPDDGRDSRLAYAVLLPEPAAGDFDECWADVWPLSDSRKALLHAALKVDTASTDPVETGQLNTRLGTVFDSLGQFDTRPTRFVVPGCALAGLLLGYAAIRLRRLEIAGALHLGQSRRALLATLALETAAWGVLAFLLSAGALFAAVRWMNAADAVDIYLIDIRGPAAAAASALIGAVLATFRIRERHLFAYFKDR
ncbi:hypothetical protein QLQ12_12570 [Actinoplanes sp. NEAU-A12]|uniref:ABC3 transporter permease protein domain-containing protein n=1 Tax=Actinoplanes sandaracinus TaxID=3045177 RepID=A0ABT6WI64_9ACTN|nr:hypothetical protein [Actinoplanes sandaracinus]MDI6099428.1 hypothetical protein [Actinoplanes sandaracinus]